MKHFNMGASLNRKLTLSYLAVFTVAMAFLLWYSVDFSRQMVYAEGMNALSAEVERIGDNFERNLERYDQLISVCAFSDELQKVYANKYLSLYTLHSKLKTMVVPLFGIVHSSMSDEVKSLQLYSQTGLCNYDTYIRNSDAVSDQEWYVRALNADGIAWNIGDAGLYATCSIVPYSPLLGREALGVLYLEIDLNKFVDNWLSLNQEAYELAIYSGAEQLLKRTMGQGAFGDCLEVGFDNAETGWTFVYRVPRALLYGSPYRLSVFSVALPAGCALSLLALIFIFTRTLLNGLKQLHATMTRVSQGDLNVSISSQSRDEIGVLTNTFNDMLDKLRRLIERTKNDERLKGELELRILRAQIDPHFLYNTLSFINWKCIRAGQDDVSGMIEELSTFYRTCLNKGQEQTTVRNEVTNVRAYVAIQLKLHNDGFDALYEIPEELYDCVMPNFILQPVVENAILHGIDKQRAERGRLVICLCEREGMLIFTVLDNGPGLTDDMRGLPDSKGYGLKNVDERLRLHYGDRCGVTLKNAPYGGCMVELRFPSSSG